MKKIFDKETINWCGYEWECCMEDKRIIHSDLPWYWMDKEQVFIDSDYTLYLYLIPKVNTVKYWNGKTYYPTQACGTIRSIRSFSYGSFSADIKLPKGSGLWPSFWLSGDENWPPEIDIMEAWNSENNYFEWIQSKFPWINPGWKTTNNIHYNNDAIKTQIGSKNISIFKQRDNPAETFINYRVDWFPNEIVFYVNDKVVRRIKNKICRQLVENINRPDKSYKMDVIFNVWCENPEENDVFMESPMSVKNFAYIPYE